MSSLLLETSLAGRSVTDHGQAQVSGEKERDRALETFLANRRSMFHVAFRIVHDGPRAEDCVQDAWLRWQLTDRSDIANPAAFLQTTVTHLAINLIQTAAHRRESPSGFLPETVSDRAPDPAESAERSTAVAEVLTLLMARLSHSQFAAYLLRKGFGYSYEDIARLLRTTAPNVRQLIHRAQARVAVGGPRRVSREALRLFVIAFLAAARAGDFSGLERLLTQGCPPTPLHTPVPAGAVP